MTRTYTFAQTLVQISGLTRAQLDALIAAEAVVPKATDAGPAFDEADLARLDGIFPALGIGALRQPRPSLAAQAAPPAPGVLQGGDAMDD